MTFLQGTLLSVDFDEGAVTLKVRKIGRIAAGAFVVIDAQSFDELMSRHPDAIAIVTRMRGDAERGSGRVATRARAEGIARTPPPNTREQI